MTQDRETKIARGGVLNFCGELPSWLSEPEVKEARETMQGYLGGLAYLAEMDPFGPEEDYDYRRFTITFPEGTNVAAQVRVLHVVHSALESMQK